MKKRKKKREWSDTQYENFARTMAARRSEKPKAKTGPDFKLRGPSNTGQHNPGPTVLIKEADPRVEPIAPKFIIYRGKIYQRDDTVPEVK